MADWVYLTHPDIDTTEPHPFPNDPETLRVYEARGWKQVDPPDETPYVPPKVELDESEQDLRGVAWVVLQHGETGAQHRFPAEAADGLKESGWDYPPPAKPEPKTKAKKKAESSTAVVDDETEKE